MADEELNKRRIWHQSYTDLSTLPRYADRLVRHAQSVLSPRSDFELHGLPVGTPIPLTFSPYVERLLDLEICAAASEAEQGGYAAVSIGCWNDPALREARSLVSIPVLGLAETAMAVARFVGRTFGLISLNRLEASVATELAHHHGHGERLACSIHVEPEITEADIENADGPASQALLGAFQVACVSAERLGAEVIIPAEGVLNTFLVDEGFTYRGSAVLIDPLGILWAQTECFISMRETLGLEVSRHDFYRHVEEREVAELGAFIATRLAQRHVVGVQ